MKNRKCPYKGDLCYDYGDCENCKWGKLIDKYERKIKRLKSNVLESKKEAEKETARDCLKILHSIGGCDATEEWSKGWDAAIDEAYKEISDKYGVTAFDEEDEE